MDTAPDHPAPQPASHRGRLDDSVAREVLALAAAAAAQDAASPLSEDAELALRSDRAVHLLARDADGALVGYGQVPADADAATGEVVVHPGHRRRGAGRALVEATLAAAGRPLALWSHGDQPGAAALAARLGWRRARELWQMRRPLVGGDALPEVRLPAGVRLRPFSPGRDDAAWLAVNAAAFADHPEQGRWTQQDLDARVAEPWFDADGLLLAVDADDGRLLGFHWTKTHPPAGDEPAAGEVYVLGVHPAEQGRRLGSALTLAGLEHLAGRRLPEVLLYVDAENAAAVATYRALGFAVAATDVQYVST